MYDSGQEMEMFWQVHSERWTQFFMFPSLVIAFSYLYYSLFSLYSLFLKKKK